MAKVIELHGALAPNAPVRNCGECLHFQKKDKTIPDECRECRHFPYKRGNVKDNFHFALVKLASPRLEA